MPDDRWFPKTSPSNTEINKLYVEQMQKLSPYDRARRESATRTISTFTVIGAALGVGFGVWLAARNRRSNMKVVNAFNEVQRPIAVIYANGRGGLTAGVIAADEKLKKDMESRRRIMTAFKGYHAGWLKIQAGNMEKDIRESESRTSSRDA
ncbi:MAG: hypothetical protein Q9209_001468 [Squamulea sp. 1 TL-2023]